MRIIAGSHGSRRIAAPRGLAVRPTSDRAREMLFNILGGAAAGGPFLDLFAGSGAVGLEALSRGAERAVFVEKERAALAALTRNIESLGLRSRCRLLKADWESSCRRLAQEGESFAVIFADPPYDSGLSRRCLLSERPGAILRPGGLLVIEHRRKEALPPPPAHLGFLRRDVAGEAAFSIYLKEERP